jgi:uncharacterized protein (DUF1697 family)
MKTYLVLLRGINVGGKNKIPMSELKQVLEGLGFENVITYIQSGNVILRSDLEQKAVGKKIQENLSKKFKLDSEIIKVLVLRKEQLQKIFKNKPKGFGDQPGKYKSDVVFLINISPLSAMSAFSPREGVDEIWPGKEVIYSQRLSAKLTKSGLSKIVGAPQYKSMTIRNWNTTMKLLEILQAYS